MEKFCGRMAGVYDLPHAIHCELARHAALLIGRGLGLRCFDDMMSSVLTIQSQIMGLTLIDVYQFHTLPVRRSDALSVTVTVT